MNHYFNFADWIVILVYLGGIIGLGVWFGKDQRNTRDYFLGSKNIPWWGIGLSIVAAETSALTIIGVPSMAYGTNITFIQIIIGYVVARIILAIVMVPHYLKGEIYSPYQLFANTLGQSARQTAGGFFLISETLAAGVRVYVASIPVKLMLGDKVLSLGTGDPILGAILLFVLLSLLYTYIGGVKAVIWTDAVQFGLFLLGGVFALFYIPTLVEGGFSTVMNKAAEAGKLHWLNFAPPPGVSWVKFIFDAPLNIWMGVIGGTVMVMSSHGAEQLIVQRVLACKNVRDGRRALALSAVVILPMFLIFLLVGVMLWVFYQGHPFQIPLPEPRPGIKANDFIFPIFMMTEVPHVLKGFLIVAILSAAMSSVSSALTSLASVSTMDFVKSLSLKNRSEEFYLRFSKWSTVGWAVILVLTAYLSRQVEFVLTAAFTLRGLTSGALLGGLMLAVFWKSARASSVITGMVVSLLVMIGVSQFSWSVKPDEFGRAYPLLEDKALGDAQALAFKFQKTNSTVNLALRNRFNAETLRLLESSERADMPKPLTLALRKALLEEFNQIIKSPSLREQPAFSQLSLSEEEQRLETSTNQFDTAFLNRLLLADCFQKEIVRYPTSSIFWPWFTLIGLLVTLVVAWLTSKIFPARHPQSQS